MRVSFLDEIKSFEGCDAGPPVKGPDPVNQPMIRHWCEAIGDTNPVYTDPVAASCSVHKGIVAPPVMLQAWVMPGIRGHDGAGRGRPGGSGAQSPTQEPVRWGNAEEGGRRVGGATNQDRLMQRLDAAGFTSVVATNCEQEYYRYLRPGDELTVSSKIESVSDEKSTALGKGHFVTNRIDYRDQDGDLVATMTFRILKFHPAVPKTRRPKRPRPAITHDNAFFFEGAKESRLLIQRCKDCKRLRHPPGPMCPHCNSLDWDTVESLGRGTIYSFVVNHHPQLPGFEYPLVVGLIELEEGTRLVSNVIGVEPERVRIGMPVQVEFVEFDEDLTLPQFRPVDDRAPEVTG